ncbi:alpha/beta fold hydrolase [Sulfurospirillum sp. T05]|uniref:Alpha/beta fold hydrolase n=1 Tax=Sulfurospirillum tamanense TaxID=2813362 RepID=A0ABS2WUV7_9BACT|nr:YqiA/YcfP family alpha/beta fold hydrolase [Sulfurospirillum tamanensis]MBN2965442.1 alpha/beta fold hydrolase [Sulfurospirillum tamanensis]
MIIYIHGFGGSGKGTKASLFKTAFQNHGILTPSLPTHPDLALSTLEELIAVLLHYEKVSLIGSSLGGFYAQVLSAKFNLKAVLINPATEPYITLKRALGNAPHFYDNSTFLWQETHLEALKKKEGAFNPENFLVLLQKGDEVLDYTKALEKYDGAAFVVEEGGSHSFEGIQKHFEKIEAFFSH